MQREKRQIDTSGKRLEIMETWNLNWMLDYREITSTCYTCECVCVCVCVSVFAPKTKDIFKPKCIEGQNEPEWKVQM